MKLDLSVKKTQPDLNPAKQARDIIKSINAQPKDEHDAPGMIIVSGGDDTVNATLLAPRSGVVFRSVSSV